MRDLIEIYLSLLSYKITPASDGREAVELFKNEKFDVILMDMRMPVMDGLEATELIRQNEKEKNSTPIPIIAMTAYSEEEEINETYKAGCDYHIVKPVSRESVVNILTKALNGK
jgi:two-component system, sensor histidine kinase and response regulator